MKEKVFKKRNRRVISGVLALSMVPTLIPMNSITVLAKTVYSTGEFTFVGDHRNGEFRIGTNTLEEGDLLKAGTVYRETDRAEVRIDDGELNDGDTLQKDMYIASLYADHGMLVLYEAPTGYETWPETVHEGCDHSSADHFYASGNTYSDYTQIEMVEGVWFFTAWERLNKRILAGNASVGGQPMPSDFETDTINPGWYYKDENGVYKRCKSAVAANTYTLTIPATATASDSGFNEIGDIEISDGDIAVTKKIVITPEGSEFKSTDQKITTTIGYTVEVATDSGSAPITDGLTVSAAEANAGYKKTVGLNIDAKQYDAAEDGEYKTTITWTAKILNK